MKMFALDTAIVKLVHLCFGIENLPTSPS